MFQKLSAKTVHFLSWYAAEPDDSAEWRLKKTIGVVTVAMGSLSWLAYGLMYIPFNEPFAAIVCISASILFVLGLLSYGIFRHYAAHWYYWFAINTLGVPLVHFIFGGFALSGMVLLWVFVLPLETLVAYKPRHGLIMFLSVVVIFIIAAFVQPYNPRLTNNLPPNLITWLFVMNTVGVSTYMILAIYYYVWRNDILSRLVLREQEKADALLLNILPKEVATILKNENRVIADQFESTSILFADVVNFTPMSATMTPTELVELLNEVYSFFDTLVEKYDLEKIKTIGDCYMVAAGVPRRRPDHALVLTQLALNIRDYVDQNEFNGHKLNFRIGINSGSVVAGVIGRKKFIYDLWGDAVNTASRMESHSAGGFIQITEATYNLIKEDFVCKPRGTIQVKGKGEMPVWFVLEKR
jgi:adenylate cyclase